MSEWLLKYEGGEKLMIREQDITPGQFITWEDDHPDETRPPSADDITQEHMERAQWLWDNLPLRQHGNKAEWLKVAASVSVAAHQAGERAGREQDLRECSKLYNELLENPRLEDAAQAISILEARLSALDAGDPT